MKKKKLVQKIEYAEYVTIGLAIGLVLAFLIDINLINGLLIGLSLGILLQKIIQEKKILLAIFILLGLVIACTVSNIFEFSKSLSALSLSVGMLLGTVIYLLTFKKEKKHKLDNIFAIYLFCGSTIGFIAGFISYKLVGACLGIGFGMILSIIFYLKRK